MKWNDREALKAARLWLERVTHAQEQRVGRPLTWVEQGWVLAAVLREHGAARGMAAIASARAVAEQRARVRARAAVMSPDGPTARRPRPNDPERAGR